MDGDIPCTANVEKNYTYYFNVCNGISGQLPANCRTAEAALQVDERGTTASADDNCYVVGRYSSSDAQTSSFSLISDSDPSKGVRLTYTGDNCDHDANGAQTPTPRKFHLDFRCADTPVTVPTHALEYRHCEYTVDMPSQFGCPVECPVRDRRLCSGRGHCGYDYDARRPMCFCNDGFAGEACEMTTAEAEGGDGGGASAAVTGIIVMLFLMSIVMAAALFFMARQVQAYRNDASNYMALRSGDEEG